MVETFGGSGSCGGIITACACLKYSVRAGRRDERLREGVVDVESASMRQSKHSIDCIFCGFTKTESKSTLGALIHVYRRIPHSSVDFSDCVPEPTDEMALPVDKVFLDCHYMLAVVDLRKRGT
jgi:hypothetical protein